MLLRSRCYATVQVLNCRSITTSSRTVDPVEIATFERLSHEWMDEEGHFKPLHAYNRLRVPWIVNGLGKVGYLLLTFNYRCFAGNGSTRT